MIKGISQGYAQRPDDPPPRSTDTVAPATKPDRGYWNYADEDTDVYCIRSAMAIRLSFTYEVDSVVRKFALYKFCQITTIDLSLSSAHY